MGTISKYEKKIRIRTAKRVNYKVAKKIPTSKVGISILKIILFIEKTLRK